jgi:uncharacterized protein (DUF885 family)
VSSPTAHDELRALAGEYWDATLEASPTTATLLGDHRFDERIEDLSEAADAARRARLVSLHERLEALGRQPLDRSDGVTLALLLREIDDAITVIDERLVELQSDQMQGAHVAMLFSWPLINAPEPDHAERLLARMRQVPAVLDQAFERFVAGAERGRTPARINVERSLSVIDGYLATPLDKDAFASVGGPVGWDGEAAWRQELTDVARDVVRPAYQRLRDNFADRLLPIARPDNRCGLRWLDDGALIYATLSRHHTSLVMSPDEIHAIGMAEVTDKLPQEYAEVGGRLFGTTDVPAIFERLRRDPALKYGTGEEILADARRTQEAAAAAMGDWFGRLPNASCIIEEIPEFLAADSPAAYYFPPAADGSRPGTYYVNTSDPNHKSRYESASISFHEAIPGHHLQLAIASELADVPAFQRFSLNNTAYVEGWGLYAERLAQEMGLYTNDLDRVGMLCADSLRACRLVVDTGLHALGWSRQQAIDFMAGHTPVSVDEVTVEVDRYIGMPGQALAYKLGQREIFRLREWARAELADGFDIKAFHDHVLGSGAVTLPILADLVGGWVSSVAG